MTRAAVRLRVDHQTREEAKMQQPEVACAITLVT